MSPIRRHPALQPLSRDHHFALVLAQRVLHVLEGRPYAGPAVDFDELLREARRFHDATFLPHAAREEALLTCERGLSAALRGRLLQEHDRLCVGIGAAADADAGDEARRASLRAYATLLDDHVRFEERELFPAVEATFSASELEAVAAALAAGL